MNREELIELADKILKKEASEADIKLYNAWYNSFQQSGELADIEGSEKKEILYARILSKLEDDIPATNLETAPKVRRLGTWISIAAATAAICVGIYFFNAPNKTIKNHDLTAGSADIKPGRNTATLTLANGKSIHLSDAKKGVVIDVTGLKYSDETSIKSALISKNEINKMMSIATPRGGTYQIILADGSKVWLNAASSLRFPASFAGQKQRSVELAGEAYFEISKNRQQKFVVTTKNQHVEVLGTHFNVNGYPDESNVKTTLLEGSVGVSISQQKPAKGVVLVPGQQSIVLQSKIDVKEVDVNDIIAWKEGKFVFVRENVKSIMNKIARWYDVDIVYEGDVSNKYLGGSVSRFTNVSQVLEMLSATKAVQFRIENRTVVVMPFKN